MEQYIKSIFDIHSKDLKEAPNSFQDIERFSILHSWYKHLPSLKQGKVQIYYTFLYYGEEPRYSQHPSYTIVDYITGELLNKDQKKQIQLQYHWWFIDQYGLNEQKELNQLQKIQVLDDEQESNWLGLPLEMINIIEKYPIYLNNQFGQGEKELNIFQKQIALYSCNSIWKELIYQNNIKSIIDISDIPLNQ